MPLFYSSESYIIYSIRNRKQVTKKGKVRNMKKYYIAYWKNLHRNEMTLWAYSREDAKRRFRELSNTDTTAIIQVKEITK